MLDFPKLKLKDIAKLGLLLACSCAGAQSTTAVLGETSKSSTLTFVTKNGTCLRGTISNANTASIIVQPFKRQPVDLHGDDLLQVSQGNALLFSARSSWVDVVNTHLYPREFLIVVTKNGKRVKGTAVTVGSGGITIKHGLLTSIFPKTDVATVDYLRWKPATDGFNLALEEAPWALVFYPEFYGRVAGVEGRITVRLYDASKPEDDTAISQKACFP